MRPLGVQISHMLKDRGVEVIFGIPGVHNQELYRGIEEAGITHILARHEQGAGFMADGYARATSKPGVCYVITGPGLTNILTPLGQAYSDSVPLLVISSCLDETAARKGQLHQMRDQRAAAATVCDWSEEARTAEAAYRLIDRALMEFETKRSRPKHIQVPIAALRANAPEFAQGAIGKLASTMDAIHLRGVSAALRHAIRPVVVFGGGAATAAAADFVSVFLEKFRPATFTTSAARGVVHPEYDLNFGGMLARPGSADVFARADFVLAVGTGLTETDLWRAGLGHHCDFAQINIDPEDMVVGPASTTNIVSDAMEALYWLTDDAPLQPASVWTAKDVSEARARWRGEVDAEYTGTMPAIDALRACLPDDCMIYSDMTQFAYAALEVWDMPRAGHWHHPYGFGTLGYALPAAIGGAVARRGRPTLAIAGDYGFQYTLNELGTAVELGLSLPILLWDNGKLGAIEASMTRAQIAPNSVIARNPDFGRLAEAYGALSAAPRSLAEMQSAILAAFAARRPTLVRVTPDLE